MSATQSSVIPVLPDTTRDCSSQEKAVRNPVARETSKESNASPPNSITSSNPILQGYKLIALIVSLILALFCVAVDNTSTYGMCDVVSCHFEGLDTFASHSVRSVVDVADLLTVLSTAIPSITDDFHSYRNVGWYGSAYLLTTSCRQSIHGQEFMQTADPEQPVRFSTPASTIISTSDGCSCRPYFCSKLDHWSARHRRLPSRSFAAELSLVSGLQGYLPVVSLSQRSRLLCTCNRWLQACLVVFLASLPFSDHW